MDKSTLTVFVLLIAFAGGCNNTPQTETKSSSVEHGAAANFSSAELARRTIDRRGVEAVNWGIPVVNYDVMYQSMVNAAHGSFNQILYWTRPFDWKNQTLTPNTDALYLMPFFNTKYVGPMVLKIPPAQGGTIVGTIMDCWQTPLEDVGPAGVDKRKGGKYLILPPGYKGKVPAGYIPLPSTNYAGYALLRSILKSRSDADIATAVSYGKQIKLYPLSAAAHPPETKFVDATDVIIDGTIPYDMRFFESLNRMVQSEPWLDRDKVMIDQLISLGIEKGHNSVGISARYVHPSQDAVLSALERLGGHNSRHTDEMENDTETATKLLTS